VQHIREEDGERQQKGGKKGNIMEAPYRYIQTLFQYNSVSHEFSSNIRFGMTTTSGTGLYVVYNELYETPGEKFDPLQRALFVKYSYQFDF